ncbi:MAG: SCO family protein [Myxococcota bacterium]
MERRPPAERRRSGALAGLIVAIFVLGCSGDPQDLARDTGKRSDGFSNILLRTHEDQPVRFYDDLVRDRTVIINFMYTTCPLICPGTAANLSKVHALLGDRMGDDILMLSISLDPDTDTPELLKRYWEIFGARKGWIYLRGDYDEVDLLRHQLGVYDPDPVIDADITQHSGIITFGNDRTDRWGALPALMKSDEIVETIYRFTETGDDRYRLKTRRAKKPQLYPGRGIVREIDVDASRIVVDHEDIQELMPAMTMAFELAQPGMVTGLVPGQQIDFDVEFTEGRYRIVALSATP